MSMNAATAIVLALIGAAVVAAVVTLCKAPKNDPCSGCSLHSACKEKTQNCDKLRKKC